MSIANMFSLLSADTIMQIFGTTTHEIYIFDPETLKILFVNQSACENLGYTMEEFSQLTSYDIKPEYDAGTFNILLQPLLSDVQKQVIFKTLHKRKDGTTYPIKVNLQCLNGSHVSFFLEIVEDQTVQKRNEELLYSKHNQLQAITETARDAIIMMDETGSISYWNPAAERIFGYTQQEAMGQNLHRLLAPARYWSAYEKNFQIFKTTGHGNAVGKTIELQSLRKDGVEITIELSLSALRMGEKWGAVGMVRDISERKKEHLLLQQQNDLNQKLFDAIPHPAWIIRKEDRKILAQNRAAEKLGTQIGGYCWQQIRRMASITEEQRRYYLEKGVPSPGTHCAFCMADQIFETMQPICHDLEDDGSYYKVWWVPIDNDKYLHYLIDITEQKNKEILLQQSVERYNHLSNQFQTLLDAIPYHITFQSLDYNILWANKSASQSVSVTADAMKGHHCHEVWFGRSTSCEDCPSKEAVAHKKIVTSIKNMPNGEIWKVISVPYYENGVIVGTIDIREDITHQKKLEQQLLHAQKMETVGTLAGGVAHDFNNILTAIVGYAQILLMRMGPDDKNRQYIDRILEAANRATMLTKGLLTFSRQQSGEKKPLKVNDAIRSIEKLMRKVVPENIVFQISYCAEELMINADPVQLDQVLMNLIVNARDAMPNGGTLTIATERFFMGKDFIEDRGYGTEGQYAKITVKDTGMGMDKETLSHIFEPFFTTKEVGKGTGLGLSIVYGIVKDHGGYIHCESKPGEGTSFEVYFPLLEEGKAVDSIVCDGINIPDIASFSAKETILLAEDNDVVRELIGNILREAGYRVIEAVNGEDALKKFTEHASEIQLLLTDIMMPRKNGSELHAAIKALNPQIKTIFMTGYAPDEISNQLPTDSQSVVIYKPVQPMELLQKIRDILTVSTQ